MRNAVIILSIVVVGLIIALLWSRNDVSAISAREAASKANEQRIIQSRDSLQNLFDIAEDSLKSLARTTAEGQAKTAVKHQNSKKETDELESILFVRIASDSVRDSEITRLYPSYDKRFLPNRSAVR